MDVVGEECMADFTVESSCLGRGIFTRRDPYHCGTDRVVKKCDTLLTIAHKHRLEDQIKLLHTEKEVLL